MSETKEDNRIGYHLRAARTAAALSQEELADRVGISRLMISKYERSDTLPPVKKVMLLAEFFERPLYSFFVDVEDPLEAGAVESKDPGLRAIQARLSALEAKVAQQQSDNASRSAQAKETTDSHYEEAFRKGREQGLHEAMEELRASVIDIVDARFQRPPKNLVSRLRAVKDPVRLRALVLEAATADSLQTFLDRL